LDDLRDDLLRFPILLRLGLVDVALLDQHLVGYVVARHPARARGGNLQRELLGELPEVLAFGDEVGLAVDLDQHADLWRKVVAQPVEVRLDDTLARRPPGALGRLRDALLAEDRERLLDVPAGLLERVLAVHHSCAGHLAKLPDELCGERGLYRTSSSSAVRPMNSSSETVGR